MKKMILPLAVVLALALLLAACGAAPSAGNSTPAAEAPATEAPATEAPAAKAETVRQDGERYEGTIHLEGVDQTVRYEHIVNKTAGFEMDYDYETFTRHSEENRERFVLSLDGQENPEYYLEVTHRQDGAEAAAAAVSEELSRNYEIIRQSVALDRAGSCIQLGAAEVKGGGHTADQMQVVYIIPAGDGCLIAAEHFGFDSADLFSARFRAMVNTLSVLNG